MPTPVTLDFSKAKPIQQSGVTLDFSKAVPIGQEVPPAPGIAKPDLKPLGALDAGGGWSPDDVVRGAVSGVKNMFQHPGQTGAGMVQGAMASGMSPSGEGYPTTAATGRMSDLKNNQQVQMDAQQGQADQAKQIKAAPAYAVGGVAGPALLTAGLAKGFKMAAAPLGETMQRSGAGLMNRAVGSLKGDFARGANPGKAYLDAGGGPAMSMDSLADKSATLKGEVGSQLGSLYDSATQKGVTIPADKVWASIKPPIDEARATVSGPGGDKGMLPTLDNYQSSFHESLFPRVSDGEPVGLSPNDVFGIKKNVSKNTGWGDPTQFGMKEVKQHTAGAIGGTLADEIPESKPLNAQYQGLDNFADRAGSRALTHSVPLTSLFSKAAYGIGGALAGATHSPMTAIPAALAAMAIDSIPVKTAAARGLYSTGAALARPGARSPLVPPVITKQR